MVESAVQLNGVSKSFGSVTALHPTNLGIRQGEFFSVLGPSGSGKTTVLRLIAGFERPDSGTITLGGVNVTDAPPNERNVNTVFQDYALFPHMSVRQNVEYGLRVKKVPRSTMDSAVDAMLSVVRLEGFADRRPGQLSGGQRQRVALARALVNEPQVLLLDEPLGALDLKLREDMQVELKAIQQRLGITFVYVTHDQGEALSMSDRVAVFNAGKIEQVGTPREIYEKPSSEFVAGFVGTNNTLDPDVAVRLFGDSVMVGGGMVSIRPERLRVSSTGADGASTTIVALQYLGAETKVHMTDGAGTNLVAVAPSDEVMGMTVGQEIRVSLTK